MHFNSTLISVVFRSVGFAHVGPMREVLYSGLIWKKNNWARNNLMGIGDCEFKRMTLERCGKDNPMASHW